MLEIESYGPIGFIHIKDKYVSDTGKAHGIEPSYSLQLGIPKNGDTHRTLVAEAKKLGVPANSESLRYSDGDDVTLSDGSQPYRDMWLINLSSRYPISIVDAKGNDLTLDNEPGSGSKANVAFKIGSNRDKDKLVYFLTGVQLVEVKENEMTPHRFGAFVQGHLAEDEDNPEF